MRQPTKRSMKKLIYLEMIILSALLIVAVVVVAGLKKPTGTHISDAGHISSTETYPEPTEQSPDWNPEDLQLTATQYFVFDRKASKFLVASGEETERVYPAEITKLYTAYTICETMILNPNKICTIDQEVLNLVPDGAPVAHLKAGDKITARHLLEGMLICGGYDAAYVLACESGRNFADKLNLKPADAVAVFVSEMKQLIKEKGMLDTNLVNPTGAHDPNHYTTFHDLAILSNLCAQYESIMNPVFAPEADIRLHDETVIWENANKLIDPKSEYYCSYAVGLTAGQTAADSYLLASFRKDEQQLLIGVFGCPAPGDSFADALQLFDKILPK